MRLFSVAWYFIGLWQSRESRGGEERGGGGGRERERARERERESESARRCLLTYWFGVVHGVSLSQLITPILQY